MKKIFVIIFVIICLFILSRCAVKDTPENQIESTYTMTEDTNENVNEQPEEKKLSFEYTDVHFEHTPNDLVKIDITYPQFKDEKLSALNEKIAEYAKSDFIDIMNNNDMANESFNLKETHTIKIADDNLVSIYSSGEIDIQSAAHPLAIKNSLNIHPLDLRKFKISELVEIDNNFVERFKLSASEDEQLEMYLTAFTDAEIKESLLLSKIYFDKSDTFIIYEVPHAMGDYIEVKLKNNTQES